MGGVRRLSDGVCPNLAHGPVQQEPLTQEAVWIGLERREDRLLAVERTVSGRPAETVESLCLRIQCADPEQARTLLTLFRATDWDSGVIVVD